jgi:RNA polymerase sigma factor (sigma-70 family)
VTNQYPKFESRGQGKQCPDYRDDSILLIGVHTFVFCQKPNTEEDLEDLISIGTIGLIKEIESFSPDKGTKLATFAARCIENEILMHLRSMRE